MANRNECGLSREAVRTLQYACKAEYPLFGGPMSRGVLPTEYAEPIPTLVNADCLVPVDGGFIVTVRGRAMAKAYESV